MKYLIAILAIAACTKSRYADDTKRMESNPPVVAPVAQHPAESQPVDETCKMVKEIKDGSMWLTLTDNCNKDISVPYRLLINGKPIEGAHNDGLYLSQGMVPKANWKDTPGLGAEYQINGEWKVVGVK